MRPLSGAADEGRFGGLRSMLPCITTGHLSQPGKSLDFARYRQKKRPRRKVCEE